MYVAVLALVPAFFLCKNKVRILAVLCAPILAYYGIMAIINQIQHIEPGSEAEMMSVPSQQTAYVLRRHGNQMQEEDWQILSAVYADPSSIADAYTPTRADPIKGRWAADAPLQDKLNFAKWYLSMYFKYPVEMVLGAAALDYPLFCVDTDTRGQESLLFYPNEIPYAEEELPGVEQNLASWSRGLATVEDVHRTIGSSYRQPFVARVSELFDLCVILILAVGPVVLTRYMVTSVYIAPLVLAAMFFPRQSNQIDIQTEEIVQ